MDIRSKQRAVVDALEDIKARDIVVFDTASLVTLFERVVIASGESTRQVRALADHVEKKLKALGVRVYGVEGGANSEWVLVDLGDIVVHIMHPSARSYYNLEELLAGKRVRLEAVAPKPVAAKKTPKAEETAKPRKIAKAAKPAGRAKARKATKPARSGKPRKAAKPVKTGKPAKGAKPRKTAAPRKRAAKARRR